MDYYFDGGSQPEYSIIQQASGAGDPTAAVVDEIYGAWRLAADANADQAKIVVCGTDKLSAFIDHSFMLTDGVSSEVVRLESISGNELTFYSNLAHSYTTNANATLFQWSLGGLSADPQIVENDSSVLIKLLHEALHRLVVADLADLKDSRSPDNIMNYTISGNGTELRYLELKTANGGTECQWKKIH